jgi:uridine phosphorylase
MSVDWGQQIGEIVDGWLFNSPGPLPTRLLLPLENPHLHNYEVWQDALGVPRKVNGVVAEHNVGNHKIGVAKPVLGGTSTAMVVEAVARRGVQLVVGVGFCGGTNPSLQCGDVIVASCAHARDGVSRQYCATSKTPEASSRLLTLIEGRARIGPVLSVAAVHLENQELVDECVRSGILGIDLESASLYTVARLRGLAAIAVLVVSDVPARGARAEARSLNEGFVLALGLAVSIIQEIDLT